MAFSFSTQRYNSKSVFLSTGDSFGDQSSGAITQLARITDLSFSIPYAAAQVMYLNAANESYQTVPPPVDVTLKYSVTSPVNEYAMGLAQLLPPSGAMGFALDTPRNLYLSIENTPGVDAIGATGSSQTKTVIGLSQALLTSYQINASVGSLITAQASFNCLTANVYSGSVGQRSPTVNYQNGAQTTGLFSLPAASTQYNMGTGLSTGALDYASALSSSEMIMMFPVGTPFGVVTTGYQECYLQSMSINLAFDRKEKRQLGYVYPSSRAILYPIRVDVTTNAIVSQYQADQLARFNCLATGQYVYMAIKQPCSNETLFGFYFDNLQIDSQDFTTTIGKLDVVSIKWKGLITNYSQPLFNPFVNYIFTADNTGIYGAKW